MTEIDITLLADAQTSGGLVFGVDPELADGVVADETSHSPSGLNAKDLTHSV